MEDIAFSDWPGQPVDLSGSNPWLPAYGYPNPGALLDKDDFLGNPDGALFLHGSAGTHYVLLDTIVEETSDDLRSESDRSGSRSSPVAWLATDSESGSVIHIDFDHLDTLSSASDSEFICPAKRRRADPVPSSDADSCNSAPLSRTSSLVQFETLERHCQQDGTVSPGVLSLDSLERRRLTSHGRLSPDSLGADADTDSNSESGSSEVDDESADSDETLQPVWSLADSCRSVHRLRPARSVDSLTRPSLGRTSAENLSEDSGYGDQLCNYMKNRSSSIPNIMINTTVNQTHAERQPKQKKTGNGFVAYDGEPVHTNFASHFAASCQDLSACDRYCNMPPLLNKRAGLYLASECAKYNLDETLAVSNVSVGSRPLSTLENMSKLTEDTSSSGGSDIEPLKPPIVEFTDDEPDYNYSDPVCDILDVDAKIQKAISESSVRSLDVVERLDALLGSVEHRCVVKSTPNLLNGENRPALRRAISGGSTSGSTKGVHFCPIVSEVSWRDTPSSATSNTTSDSESEAEFDSSSSSTSPPVRRKTEHIRVTRSQPELIPFVRKVEHVFIPLKPEKCFSTPDVRVLRPRRPTSPPPPAPQRRLPPTQPPPPPPPRRILEEPSSSTTFKPVQTTQNPSTKPIMGVQQKKSTINQQIPNQNSVSTPPIQGQKRQIPATRQASIVTPPTANHVTTTQHRTSEKQQHTAAVIAMESTVSRTVPAKQTRASKLGGFLSRFASFRFSAKKKKQIDEKRPPPPKLEVRARNSTPEYIYIPLKDPTAHKNTTKVDSPAAATDVVNSRKPPLPRAPPRVVGASVKRPNGEQAQKISGDAIDCNNGVRRMEPMGLIETDLDTEVTVITSGVYAKTRSLMNLGAETTCPGRMLAVADPATGKGRPHKSMEFLLDKDNLKSVEPPENELQKGTGDRVMSEHQLRVQRSLQKLTVPDWYKHNQVPKEGFLLRSRREPRWTGTGSASPSTGLGVPNSKTPSLSSLGSGHSPILLSPAPHSQTFMRWSTSKLNSAASSPCASTRSSFNQHRTSNGGLSPCSARSSFSYRQPYLGWRSQERLARPRTPAERLATSLLPPNQPPQQQDTNAIQTSIKEVTSAIVHYVSGLKPDSQDRNSTSPGTSPRFGRAADTASQRSGSPHSRGSQKLCWLESSFVGTRPLDSPQTPLALTDATPPPLAPSTPNSLRLDLRSTITNELARQVSEANRPSPSSTTLEDVLDSLLGLPPSTRAPSPSLQGRREV